MAMRDWISKLDDFLRLSDRDVLRHAGKVAHEEAQAKAATEFEKFHLARINAESEVEQAFEAATRKIEHAAKKVPGTPKRKN